MAWLYFLLALAPLCMSLPPLPRPTCSVLACQVSSSSLDSALTTFLCFTPEQLKAATEREKKLELAEKIAPYLLSADDFGVQVEALADLDTGRLVPLVNLILHDEANVKNERKSEEEHFEGLVEHLAKLTKLNSDIFLGANPIVLSQIYCARKYPKLKLPRNRNKEGNVASQRHQRGDFISEKEQFFNTFTDALEAVNTINGVLDGATGAIDDIIDGATGGLDDVIGGITGGAMDALDDILGGVTGGATNALGGVLSGITGGAIDDFLGGVTGGLGSTTDDVEDTLENIIG